MFQKQQVRTKKMSKYICTGCGFEIISDEAPDKCPECDAINKFIKIDNPSIAPIEVEEETPQSKSIGFTASPQKIKAFVKSIFLPAGNKPYISELFFNVSENGVFAYTIANGETLLSVVEIDKEYFDEVWGEGKLPIKSLDTIEHLSVLSSYNKATIQLDTVNNLLIHNSGANAEFADTVESTIHITQSRESVKEIFEFDHGQFIPILSGDVTFAYRAVINVKELAVLLDVASKKKINYYPLMFDSEGLHASVGDMVVPTKKGAFKLKIPVNKEKSVFPSSPISIDAGSVFENVVRNLPGEISIYFAVTDGPIWITGTFDKKVKVKEGDKELITDKVVGNIGHVVTARIKDME